MFLGFAGKKSKSKSVKEISSVKPLSVKKSFPYKTAPTVLRSY